MMTKEERIASRKKTIEKYNRSEKKKAVNKRYRESHKAQCSSWSIAWQKRNREHVSELERKRNATPEGKEIRKAIQSRYNAKNRIKRLAKDAIHNAIKAGKMIKQPCKICGKKIVEGHHQNYSYPLKVVWLCKKHHLEEHRK
jgi:hypothetical protein